MIVLEVIFGEMIYTININQRVHKKLTSIKKGPIKLRGNFFTNKLKIKELQYDTSGFISSVKNYNNLIKKRQRKKILNKLLNK